MRRLIGFGVLTLFMACSKAPPPEIPPAPEEKKDAEGPELPDNYIARGQLEAILVGEGPPWILERVPVEAVLDGEEFVGWRVLDLPVAWKGVDLREGDVVVAVNAMPLETPSDFWAAWTTLSVASELKVAYVREGEERELSVPILGSPSPVVSKELKKQHGAPPPAERRQEPRKETVVIEGEDKPLSDTNVDYSN